MISKLRYVHGLSEDAAWTRSIAAERSLGLPVRELWIRHLIDQDPHVAECKLDPEVDVPAHSFDVLVIQWFTDGALLVDGEGSYEAGDVRVSPARCPSPPWRSSPDGSRFYVFALGGAASATLTSPSADPGAGERPQRFRLQDVSWEVMARGDHVAPPGQVKAIYSDGRMYFRLLRMDPRCVIGPHSHPGNIVYLMTKGSVEIPGEGIFRVGDARWAPKNLFYPGEIAGRDGAEFIFVQGETDGSVSWWGTDTPQ